MEAFIKYFVRFNSELLLSFSLKFLNEVVDAIKFMHPVFILALENSSLSTVLPRFSMVKDLFASLPKESATNLRQPQLTGMIIRVKRLSR